MPGMQPQETETIKMNNFRVQIKVQDSQEIKSIQSASRITLELVLVTIRQIFQNKTMSFS